MDPSHCIICNSSKARSCSSCHSISYCSVNCQKLDWRLHKKVCKAFTTLSSRPSPSHKLAIVLPVDSKDPQLVWIECEQRIDSDRTWETAEVETLLEAEGVAGIREHLSESRMITRNVRREYKLSYTVQIIYRETAIIDGSSRNVCVGRLTKWRLKHEWNGPVIVMRLPSTDSDPPFYEDVKASDLGIAIDQFFAYNMRI